MQNNLGGETIKSISQQSGARIELQRNPPPNADPNIKMFTVRGTPQQIDYARQLVEEKIGVSDLIIKYLVSQKITVVWIGFSFSCDKWIVLRVLSVLWVDLMDHLGHMEAPHRMAPQAHLDLLHLWDLTIQGLITKDLLDPSKSLRNLLVMPILYEINSACLHCVLFVCHLQWSSGAIPTSGLG